LIIRLKNIELISKKILNQLMQKKIKKIFILLLVLLLTLSCKNKSYSRYSSIKNEDSYFLELNDSSLDDSFSMFLKENDEIAVSYSIKKGRVDLLISNELGEKIYKGNSIKGSASFIVNAKEDGVHTINVNAKSAEGVIDIKNLSYSSSRL